MSAVFIGGGIVRGFYTRQAFKLFTNSGRITGFARREPHPVHTRSTRDISFFGIRHYSPRKEAKRSRCQLASPNIWLQTRERFRNKPTSISSVTPIPP